MNLTIGHYAIIVLFLCIVAFGWLLLLNSQELQELKALQASVAVPSAPAEPVPAPLPPEPPTEPRNPHTQAIGTIETDAGMRLSRIAALIIRDEGDRTRPYLDPSGVPTIGVGRNLRGNGISVTELQAIVTEIDYGVVLRETHVQGGRVRIGSLKLANRIFTKPLTEHDIQLLLTDDLNNVRKEAVGVFGQAVWQSTSELRKEAILDVMFNLGLTRFKGFVNFIGAVKKKDWNTAAAELLLSDAARKNIVRYHRNAVVIQNDKDYFGL